MILNMIYQFMHTVEKKKKKYWLQNTYFIWLPKCYRDTEKILVNQLLTKSLKNTVKFLTKQDTVLMN